MNNPFDYTPSQECREAFLKLSARIEALRQSASEDDRDFCRELDAGKMLGVLVAEDSGGTRHELCAFSGQLGRGGFRFPGFVGPVFDYLHPSGHFKAKETEISALNREIALFEMTEMAECRAAYERTKSRIDSGISALREAYRLSKLARGSRRASGLADEAELSAMILRSQFEKAELRRLRKKGADELRPYGEALEKARAHVEALKARRRAESETLQEWLFSEFRLLNARGETRSLSEIFAATSVGVPPSGAGECCAPKLLNAAYLRGWRPVAMAEYWYGRPKGGEVRRHGSHYPACRGKCLPVLGWMLTGLEVEPPLGEEWLPRAADEPEVVFENEWFCVVDKPAGMLSVPGKGEADSVQRWLERRYGAGRGVKVAHRLDQDTSGLLVAAFGQESHKVLQSLFARRLASKTYVADLAGDYRSRGLPAYGRIDLPLSPDWLDRPRQRVDPDGGKEAVTEFEFQCVTPEGLSRVELHPLTGRTHQLRVHAASGQGLGLPIAGDRLYGSPSDRLHLHAHRLSFVFPTDGVAYGFESPVPF